MHGETPWQQPVVGLKLAAILPETHLLENLCKCWNAQCGSCALRKRSLHCNVMCILSKAPKGKMKFVLLYLPCGDCIHVASSTLQLPV